MIGIAVGWLRTTGRVVSAAVVVALGPYPVNCCKVCIGEMATYLGVGARAGHVVTFTAIT